MSLNVIRLLYTPMRSPRREPAGQVGVNLPREDLPEMIPWHDNVDVEQDLHDYIDGDTNMQGVGPLERYASFDYCFNHFQSFRERGKVDQLASPEYMQLSCLQLGFYLASWGMLRGSTFLFTKSAKVYEGVVHAIAAANWHFGRLTLTATVLPVLSCCWISGRPSIGR